MMKFIKKALILCVADWIEAVGGKRKHEKRIVASLNVLAVLWRLFTFWKKKRKEADENEED